MKAFIIFVVVLLIMLGAGAGWFYNNHMNRNETRGAGLTLEKDFPAEEIDRLTERYNIIIDRDEVLLPAFEKHNLASYYEDLDREAALEQFREDTYVRLPGGPNLHILFDGKRKTRAFRDAVSEDLAKDFLTGTQRVDF